MNTLAGFCRHPPPFFVVLDIVLKVHGSYIKSVVIIWENNTFTSAVSPSCMHAKSFQSCLTLCSPMGCNLPGSSLHGDSPGKNAGVGCPCPPPGDLHGTGLNLCLLHLPALAGGFFTTSTMWEVHHLLMGAQFSYTLWHPNFCWSETSVISNSTSPLRPLHAMSLVTR